MPPALRGNKRDQRVGNSPQFRGETSPPRTPSTFGLRAEGSFHLASKPDLRVARGSDLGNVGHDGDLISGWLAKGWEAAVLGQPFHPNGDFATVEYAGGEEPGVVQVPQHPVRIDEAAALGSCAARRRRRR